MIFSLDVRRARKGDCLLLHFGSTSGRDLLMVSHIDDDHIQGILELTKEEIAAKESHRPQLLNVQSFWHNSFDAIIDRDPEELTSSVNSHFGTSAVSGSGELP